MNFNYIESLVAKAKNGDVSSKEIIFKEFRPMILNISKRTFVHGYDFSDIEHECYATLLKCIKIYDLDKKRFVAYATMAIKNNIKPKKHLYGPPNQFNSVQSQYAPCNRLRMTGLALPPAASPATPQRCQVES